MHEETKNTGYRKDIVLLIVGTLLTAIIGSIGYISKIEYFDKKNKTELYIIEKHKELFDEGTGVIKNTKKTYKKLIHLLKKNYGLTPQEYEKIYKDFWDAKLKIIEYRNKLEKFSFDDIIYSIDNIMNVVDNDLALIGLHFKQSEMIRDEIGRILYNANPKKIPEATDNLMKNIEIKNNKELTDFINFENMLYFKLSFYSLPLVEALERNFDYQFRKRLNLGITNTLTKKLNEIPKLVERWKLYKYNDKNYPFVIASFRTYAAPDLNMEGDLLKNKDDFEKANILLKFIISASITTYNLDKNITK
ncbi:hypothetical protein [Sulfurimonas sp. ST-27]|uniref:hypothetical protein n=1 Tax=Sulfurimonas sp. ST-27 TaxID=3400152 RepID=UPI003AB8E9F2